MKDATYSSLVMQTLKLASCVLPRSFGAHGRQLLEHSKVAGKMNSTIVQASKDNAKDLGLAIWCEVCMAVLLEMGMFNHSQAVKDA